LRPGTGTAALRPSAWNPELATLEQLHLEQLEAAGQIDAALALLREDLRNAPAHHRLIAFLERQDRHDEALAQAEVAHKQFPDDWSLQQALLRGYEQAGRMQEALALRHLQFEQRPGVQGFQAVLQAARSAGQDADAWRERLLAFLEAQEQAAAGRPRSPGFGAARDAVPPGARDVSLRAEILGTEERWSEACRLVQPPAWCSAPLLRRIALHLPADQRDAALQLLLQVFDRAMAFASSPYHEELALVNDIARLMDAAPRAAWLSELRLCYKPKRNFIKGLPMG
jgi:hypothetical protein